MTPGLGAASHIFRFKSRLIIEDLPTFGYPTTAALTLRGRSPFALLLTFISAPQEPVQKDALKQQTQPHAAMVLHPHTRTEANSLAEKGPHDDIG